MDLSSKTYLVTGATAGIGTATALALAKLGTRVIVQGRSDEKTARVAAEIRTAADNPRVETLIGDLSDLSQVRGMAEEFLRRFDRLDGLVNNAGAIIMSRRESMDGFEMTLAVNHLAHFLLTNLLLDVLKASAPARIINVSSSAHFAGKINFDDLQLARGYTGFRAYSQSKLANVLFTYELARRLEGSGVTANALHPGVVATEFAKNNGNVYRRFLNLLARVLLPVESGARTSIYLASSPEVEGVTGKYFKASRPAASSMRSYDRETARRLWMVSAELTGLKHYPLVISAAASAKSTATGTSA